MTGNPHAEKLQPEIHAIALLDYNSSEICCCTARDGTLCLVCKEQQNSDYIQQLACCIGYNCTNNDLDKDTAAGRICLWCNRILPGRRSKEERRKEYDLRDLLLSNYYKQHKERTDPSTPLKGWTSFDDQRWTTHRDIQADPSNTQTIPDLRGLSEEEHCFTQDKAYDDEDAELCVGSTGENVIGDQLNNQTSSTQPLSKMLGKPLEEDFVFVYHEDVEMLVSHTEADMAKVSSEE